MFAFLKKYISYFFQWLDFEFCVSSQLYLAI